MVRDVGQVAGYIFGGVGVVAKAGALANVPYTSPPTSTSTMPLVMRFQVASPTLRRVSPRYGRFASALVGALSEGRNDQVFLS